MKYDCAVIVLESLAQRLDPVRYRLLLGGQDLTARPALYWDAAAGTLRAWDGEGGPDGLPRLTHFLRQGPVAVFAALTDAERAALVGRGFNLDGRRLSFAAAPDGTPAARWPWMLLAALDDEPAEGDLVTAPAPEGAVNLFLAPLLFTLDAVREWNLLWQLMHDRPLHEAAFVLPPRPRVSGDALALGPVGCGLRQALAEAAWAVRPAGLDVLSAACHPLVNDAIAEGAHLAFAPDRRGGRRLQLGCAAKERAVPVQGHRFHVLLGRPDYESWRGDVWRTVRCPLLGLADPPERATAVSGSPLAFPLALFGPEAPTRAGRLHHGRQLARIAQRVVQEPGFYPLPEHEPAHPAGGYLPGLLREWERAWRERDPGSARLLLGLPALPASAREDLLALAGVNAASDDPVARALLLAAFWPALWPYAAAAEPHPLGPGPAAAAFFRALGRAAASANSDAWAAACRTFLLDSSLVNGDDVHIAADVIRYPRSAAWARALPLLHMLAPLGVAILPGLWAFDDGQPPAPEVDLPIVGLEDDGLGLPAVADSQPLDQEHSDDDPVVLD